mmetsp:Transcript_49752/g.98042  ORF Transcript_49752/g.98042 Transcript_49752/m.98042 type:complete len:345 (+) Transcript_49752:517-1551(+)
MQGSQPNPTSQMRFCSSLQSSKQSFSLPSLLSGSDSLLGSQVHHHALSSAVVGVCVLQGVEQRSLDGHRGGAISDLGVDTPGLDCLLWDPCLQEGLAEVILSERAAEPVETLGKCLERRGRGVDSVVSRVRLSLQSQSLPVGKDLSSEGLLGGLLGVGGAEEFSSEGLPCHGLGLPLHDKVVDGGPRSHELAPHAHEESVEDELPLHVPAVETSSELDELVCLLCCPPLCVQLVCGNAELLAAVEGVEDLSLGEGVLPGDAELGLELVRRDIQLIRFQEGSLGGDGIVVLVDEFFLVDFCSPERPLLLDGKVLGLELGLDKRNCLVSHSMGLDEDKGGVFHHGC